MSSTRKGTNAIPSARYNGHSHPVTQGRGAAPLRNTMKNSRILVLGVGNVLMSDEGAGVHCVQKLSQEYSFSDNVELLDGGTLGTRLLGPIGKAGALIAVDVAKQGFLPGTISKLSYNDIRERSGEKHSMHEVSFSEMLFLAETMGMLPPTIIVAIEPLDVTTVGTALTAPVSDMLAQLCRRVLDEITTAGGGFARKEPAVPWSFRLKPDDK
jgi:hydrogenase maturation protease